MKYTNAQFLSGLEEIIEVTLHAWGAKGSLSKSMITRIAKKGLAKRKQGDEAVIDKLSVELRKIDAHLFRPLCHAQHQCYQHDGCLQHERCHDAT